MSNPRFVPYPISAVSPDSRLGFKPAVSPLHHARSSVTDRAGRSWFFSKGGPILGSNALDPIGVAAILAATSAIEREAGERPSGDRVPRLALGWGARSESVVHAVKGDAGYV